MFSVETRHWGYAAASSAKFKNMTEEMLGRSLETRQIKRVYLWDHKGDSRTPEARNNQTFVIRFYASASEYAGTNKIPRRMWGFKTKFGGDEEGFVFEPSGKGLVVVEPESGYAVAELIGDELYILFPLNDSRLQDETSRMGVYRHILREALVFLGGSFPTMGELLRGDFTKPGAKTLHGMRVDLAEHRQEITRHIMHGAALSAQLQKLGENGAESDRILEQLRNIPEIKTIEIKSDRIAYRTHLMYSQHPENHNLHEYGEMQFELTFGRNARATFKNLTRRVSLRNDDRPGNYGHPHVDREGGYWCEGEGRGILRLLENYEFMAATLFAIKAIDSVNESRSGNYLNVLELFPIVKERMKYPKEKPPLSTEMREAFARIFNRTIGTLRTNLEEGIAEAGLAVRSAQAWVLQGVLAETFERLTAQETKNEGTAQNPILIPAVTALIREQMEKVKQLPGIKDATIHDDVFEVTTGSLVAMDTRTRQEYPSGPWVLQYNFLTGKILFRSGAAFTTRDGDVFQAPQLSGDGELPLGQLTATLPELLGSLELETTVILSLEFLTNFNGLEIDPHVLEQMRQAA